VACITKQADRGDASRASRHKYVVWCHFLPQKLNRSVGQFFYFPKFQLVSRILLRYITAYITVEELSITKKISVVCCFMSFSFYLGCVYLPRCLHHCRRLLASRVVLQYFFHCSKKEENLKQ